MKAPAVLRLDDPRAEQVRAEHHRAITELQRSPLAGGVVLRDVLLTEGDTIPVAHGLGRVPTFVSCSCPRGAATFGAIIEVRSGAYAADQYVVLKADDWGDDIRVDILVLG